MTEADIADWVRSLSKKERLILATYEGGTCMPESIERYWNMQALESLIKQEKLSGRWLAMNSPKIMLCLPGPLF